MSNTAPFVVSVISASSFTGGSKTRIYKTRVVWTNNAPNDQVKALSTHDTRALKKLYSYDPLEDVPAPRTSNEASGGYDNPSSATMSRGGREIDRYTINLPIVGAHEELPSNCKCKCNANDDCDCDCDETRAVPLVEINNINDVVTSDAQYHISASGGLADEADEFSLESLGEALSASSQTAREKETRRLFQARFAPTKQLQFSREITVVRDVWVLPEDNLAILKRKIQLATGIPTYRQHLWYEDAMESKTSSSMAAGAVTSPCYLLWKNDHRVETNIWDLSMATSIVHGMPVDTSMYTSRSELRVRNNEFSATLESLGLTGVDAESSRVHWFVTDLNDLITNREQLAGIIRNDIHVRELVYFGLVLQYWPGVPAGVFQTFVSNEPLLHDEYPELAVSDNLLQRQLVTETSIVAANPQPRVDKLSIYVDITDIGIINEYYAYGGVVSLRALFNAFTLSDEMPYMIGRFALGGRIHTLTKTKSRGRVPSKKRHPPIDTVCIFIILPGVDARSASSMAEALVYIHTSGVYHTEVFWREDTHTDVDAARIHTIEATNRVVRAVNALGESIVARPLVEMSQNNISIINTSIIISIARRLGVAEFDGLKENAQLFKRAGMINITSSEPSVFMFHFYKGMHSYDDARFDAISNTTNGYEHTTSIIVQQRWDGIYGRQKLTSITSRNTDIYIRASGLKYSEYAPFIKFILILVEMPIIGKVRGPAAMDKAIKSISQLKELDPLLYDLKKIYGNKTMYSQICQKPNQPVIVEKPGPKSVKYWNFTKKEVAYYECPSEKYHALYFKTGVHPKDFCIPCCKKISVVSGSKHDNIFATCMKDHEFKKAAKGDAVRSGYIISYTPEIEPGRISYLPEASLDQLFYQQFSTIGHSVDAECIPELGYYVFGMNQSILTKKHVGVLTSIAHSMGMLVAEFITETGKKIIASEETTWNLLLNGKIASNFSSAKTFAGELEMMFNSSDPTRAPTEFDEWNEVFVDIARHYWNINVIMFVDAGGSATGNVFIKVPRGIKRADELISSQHKHLFIICANPSVANSEQNIYHPVYQVDTKVFKKTGAIARTLFTSGDKIIEIIRKMMTAVISGAVNTTNALDLDEVLKWIDSQSADYKIIHAYINRSNMCYAVQIEAIKTQSRIYFPVSISLHDHLEVTRINTEFSRADYAVTWSEMKSLLDNFNARDDKKSDARVLQPAVWLLLEDKIIGFQDESRQYNYYVAPMPIDEARGALALPMVKLRYDPTVINSLINEKSSPVVEPALGRYLYEHHGYQLFVLEFVSSIDRQRNTAIRDKIDAIIRKWHNASSLMLHAMNEALVDWPRDYDHIISIVARFSKSRESSESPYGKLLSKSKTTWDAASLSAIIDQSRFEFDDTIMTSMFSMPAADVAAKLKPLLDEIIDIAHDDVDIAEFPENITTCSTTGASAPSYCKDKKLRVSEHNYKTWSAQLVLDIKNPLKQRKLMALMTRSMANEFSFRSVPGEMIYIALG